MPKIPDHILPRNEKSIAAAAKGIKRIWHVHNSPLLRLDANGHGWANWRLRYAGPDGRRTWHPLGRVAPPKFMDVIAEADRLTAGIDQGIYPLSDKEVAEVAAKEATAVAAAAARARGETFDALMRDWIEKYGKEHKRTWDQDLAAHERHIAPRLGNTPAKELTRRQIVDALDDIKANVGGTTANRVQAQISACLTWGLDSARIDAHPAHRLKKRAKENKGKTRDLKDDEICRFWHALGGLSPEVGDAIRLLLVLGQRRSDVAGMVLSELVTKDDAQDRGRGWLLQAERYKTGDETGAHYTPLPPLAAKLIDRQRPHGDFVFRGDSVTPMAVHPSTLSHKCEEVMTKLGFNPPGTPKNKIASLHTLRHTMKTRLVEDLGVDDDNADRVTGHKAGQNARGAGARYIHYKYAKEKRRALRLWALRLQEIVRARDPRGLRW